MINTDYADKKSRLHRFFLLATCYLLLATLLGCGYTTRSFIAPSIKTIYIEPFLNKIDITSELSENKKYKTYFPLLEAKITRAVVDRFVFDGNLRIGKPETADVVLKGELLDYAKDALRYNTSDNSTVEEYRLSLRVNVSLIDRNENKTLWEQNNFVGDTTYFISGSSAKSEETALSDAVKDLARRIVALTIEEW
ncbi:MAG: LptE family protein [Candidatus Omnitrophota bacterium]|nr:LptE family protein [Candidatus Omnitrophota bacterium]